MSGRIFLYALWSMGVVAMFMGAGMYSWSPFADSGRAGAARGYYGPTHK